MNLRSEGALALLIGVAAFLLYTGGGAIANPANLNWLMSGDPASSWLGWQFFRASPLLQWPLGANPGYGMDLGSSIVFSDSIPLLAIGLKPFSGLLPDAFQYFGLWLAACFMLQAWFGWKLARLCTDDRWAALAAAAFFAIAPAMCWRLLGHYALAGHWLLLAGIYLCLRPDRSMRSWALLLAVAAMVHAYLLVMTLGLFGADLLRRAWGRERSLPRSALGLAGTMALVVFLMWAAGYFMLGGAGDISVGNEPFSVYHMNLQAPIDPDGLWSRVLPDLQGGPGDYEGFAFLGSGMLLLAAAAIGLQATGWIAARRWPGMASVPPPVPLNRLPILVPMLLLSALLLGIAISNRIVLGSHELFGYELPSFATPFTSVFRVSGRFAWPVYYLVYFLIFRAIVMRLGVVQARVLLVAALVLQVADSAPIWRHLGAITSGAAQWHSPLRSPQWSALAASHDRLRIVPPRNLPDQWIALSEFAARKGLATEAGSFARIGAAREARARLDAVQALIDGPLDPGAIYVIQDDDAWRYLSTLPVAPGYMGVLDGIRVLAPRGCAGCATMPMDRGAMADTAAGNPTVAAARLLAGWTGVTPGGRWSEGSLAYAAVDIPPGSAGDLLLQVEGYGLVSERHPLQRVRVAVNGRRVGELMYVVGPDRGVQYLRVSRSLLHGPVLVVRFEFPDATTPTAAGVNDDPRMLALWLVGLRALPTE